MLVCPIVWQSLGDVTLESAALSIYYGGPLGVVYHRWQLETELNSSVGHVRIWTIFNGTLHCNALLSLRAAKVWGLSG